MNEQIAESSKAGVTLGAYLYAVRKTLGLTLRDVEEKTNKQVSNAYLSQLENNKIQQPSPNILYALSELYRIDYSKLMEIAGYVSGAKATAKRHSRAVAFADMNLTESEEAALLRYLRFIRSEKD